MKMDEGLDTGNMLLKSKVKIAPEDTREDLENNLELAGRKSLIKVLNNLESFLASSQSQDELQSCYAEKLTKKDSLINWNHDAAFISRQIRAGIGRVPAYTFLEGIRVRILAGDAEEQYRQQINRHGEILKLDMDSFKVACGKGCLKISRVQMPGKKALPVRELKNAKPNLFEPGKIFSTEIYNQ